jgi:hypothetical protein
MILMGFLGFCAGQFCVTVVLILRRDSFSLCSRPADGSEGEVRRGALSNRTVSWVVFVTRFWV